MDTIRMKQAEQYLWGPRDSYNRRKNRYDMTGQLMRYAGLGDRDIIADVGAGLCELDLCLRQDFGFRGRYVPLDGWLDGMDLEVWEPPRTFDWFVALEVLEHVHDPLRLVRSLQAKAVKGIVVTTPNPDVWDVLAMDDTHVTPIEQDLLADWGFATSLHEFHGKYRDGIAGIWLANESVSHR